MVLSGHSDAEYLNGSKARRRAGAHIIFSEDVPIPSYNGPVLTISKIIKCVMSSAAESDLAGLYICAKEMVPLCQSLCQNGLAPAPVSNLVRQLLHHWIIQNKNNYRQ